MKTKNASKLISAGESMTVEWKPSLSQMNEAAKLFSRMAGLSTHIFGNNITVLKISSGVQD